MIFGLLGESNGAKQLYGSKKSLVQFEFLVAVAEETFFPFEFSMRLKDDLAVDVVTGTWQFLDDFAVFICSCRESSSSARNSWQSCCQRQPLLIASGILELSISLLDIVNANDFVSVTSLPVCNP